MNHFTASWFTLKLLLKVPQQYYYSKRLLDEYFWDDISSKQKTKILIYATFVPNLYPFILAKSSSTGLTPAKKHIITLVAALMPINDESIDRTETTEEQLSRIFENNLQTGHGDNLLHVQWSILNRIYLLDGSKRLSISFRKVLSAQIESREQLNHSISDSKLKKIIAEKGGLSSLLFAEVALDELDRNTASAMYQLGFWLQLLDDFTDVKKDEYEEIVTLATRAESIARYKAMMNKEKEKLWSLIKESQFAPKITRELLFSIHYFSELGLTFFSENKVVKNEKTKNGFVEVFRIMSYIIKAWKKIVRFES